MADGIDMTLATPETNVVESRVFWDMKVEGYIQRFEYGADPRETFVENMARMGYDRNVIDDVLDDDEDECVE